LIPPPRVQPQTDRRRIKVAWRSAWDRRKVNDDATPAVNVAQICAAADVAELPDVNVPATSPVERQPWVGPSTAHAYGRDVHGARLDEVLVRRIRLEAAAGRTVYSLAQEHGVAYGTITAVVERRTWTHVPDDPLP
jgi:hypothetical protein